MTYGVPSNVSQQNMVCLVPVWPDAAVWTQQHLTKANAGPKKGNPDGRPPTVFQRFCRPQAQKYKILLNLSILLMWDDRYTQNGFRHPKTTMFSNALWFLLDNISNIVYAIYMLSGIRIYSADTVWRQILADLGAVVFDSENVAAINFDDIQIDLPIRPIELKSVLLNAIDSEHIIRTVFGTDVSLSYLQSMIVVLLYRSGGMTSHQLKSAFGGVHNISMHAVDTAIYHLRQTYGRDFIINKDGVYYLGKL